MLSSGSYSISGAVYSCRAAPEGTAARSTGLLLRTAGNSRKGHARKQLPAKAVATSTSRSTLLLLEPSICFYHSTPPQLQTVRRHCLKSRGAGAEDQMTFGATPAPHPHSSMDPGHLRRLTHSQLNFTLLSFPSGDPLSGLS